MSDLVNVGIYAFSPQVLDDLDGTSPCDIGYHLLPNSVGLGESDLGALVLARPRHGRCLPAGAERVGGTLMIITQTPLRIGLLGGGTDLPDYYRERGGRVLNCAIDKYIYVIVKQRFDDEIYINYSKKEIVERVEDIEHELVREAMFMTGVTGGVEITTLADIPSAGSGLGSSSSVTVGLLHALYAYQGHQVSATELAERACTIEIERCGKPIGKQDQYIAAFGGILVTCALARAEMSLLMNWTWIRLTGARCSARSCCSTPGSREARIRSSPSRARTSRPRTRSLTCCATWLVRRSACCRAVMSTLWARCCGKAGGEAQARVRRLQ